MPANETFHHALIVDEEKCICCTHCVKVCPTEAIRIVDGKVVIREERCVDCGECVRACPQKAIGIDHDDLELINQYKYRVALFPSVFLGQFPERITEDKVYASLLKIGFTHAYEVEQPIGVLKELLRKEIKSNDAELPLISSFCPAVVRMIQIKYPSLTEYIARVKAPHDLAAHFVLEKLHRQGIAPEEVGLFYITPCVAKIAAVKTPVSEKKSVITGVVSPKLLYNKVMAVADDIEPVDSSELRSELTKEGIQWSLTHGETWWQTRKTMAVDGIHNVIRFLERLENDEIKDIDFIELRACDRSCAAGVLLSQNRFLTVERLKRRARRYPSAEKKIQASGSNQYAHLELKVVSEEVKPRPLLRFGTDMEKAMVRMQRARNIMCHLPGIDCGACGAPSCVALAEDMANGQAKMSDCIFVQQLWQKDHKVKPEKAFERMEKKWGDKRFDPDCTKIGAKNENN
ncbi:[Fe-Fe] hydrogenase large subunit C-terminal domain-containing protein [Roseimarinus sediminis]|jgi:iron only hydrogenase large subunit-like protein|uniref:[Fe-Fe] hydrogenase large subunit C-terminal domain-containing protein n=1 Tax=Roseimarinus sediminis TaxID=1610899 RepID=UPI003D241DC8